jgi:hypothetical protein
MWILCETPDDHDPQGHGSKPSASRLRFHLRDNHSCRSLPMLDDMVFADLERTEIELASLF